VLEQLGSTPLHIAAHFTGADPESRHYHVAPADEERMAPALTKLMCCALVDAGADINAQDEVHKTSSRHARHLMRSIMIESHHTYGC